MADQYTYDAIKLGKFIEKIMHEKKLETKDLEGEYVNIRTIQKIIKGDTKNPGIQTLLHISKKLKLDLEDMIFESQHEQFTYIIDNYRNLLFKTTNDIKKIKN